MCLFSWCTATSDIRGDPRINSLRICIVQCVIYVSFKRRDDEQIRYDAILRRSEYSAILNVWAE